MAEDKLKQQIANMVQLIPKLSDVDRRGADLREERIQQVSGVIESLARLHGERVSEILVELSGTEITDPDVAYILTSVSGEAARAVQSPEAKPK